MPLFFLYTEKQYLTTRAQQEHRVQRTLTLMGQGQPSSNPAVLAQRIVFRAVSFNCLVILRLLPPSIYFRASPFFFNVPSDHARHCSVYVMRETSSGPKSTLRTESSRGSAYTWLIANSYLKDLESLLCSGAHQRPCITRRWTHAVLCLGWLNIF